MVIGVDIDGVLCELNKYTWHYFKKYLKENQIPFKFNKTKERFFEQFNVAEENEEDFWETFVFHYAKHGKMVNNASKYMQKLHKDGHKIVIVTSRRHSIHNDERGEKMRKAITDWLKKNKIYYDNIRFSSERIGKKDLVIQEKADIMIEDSIQNVNELAEIIPVLVFKNPANKICKGKNKIIVNSWKDIYKYISNLKK